MPFDYEKYNKRHAANLVKYGNQLKKAYTDLINQVAKLGIQLKLDANGNLFFRGAISRKIDKLILKLYEDVLSITISGINTEWDLAVEKNNALALYIYGKELKNLPKNLLIKYLSGNDLARKNFIERKINGLGLSDRIWKNTQQFKQELELALELGIGKGQSAQSLAAEIKKYLNEPDKLFRRVRDASGELRLSKAAKAYHPGRGIYRSSFKNAFRLTRNETNFSYEGSSFEKRKQQDFVVGVKIIVSPQHKPADDASGVSCLELQGNYPKDFDFTYKWHVNCKCTALDIRKTREELSKDIDKILAGEEPDTPSVNTVHKNPANFNQYIKDNQKKWAKWKNKPRFLVNHKG